jgi:hypothetical protein
MRALTVRQPWASLITLGLKRVENRTWRIDPQRIIIHAGKETAEGQPETQRALRSAFVGTVQVVECHRAGSQACEDAGCPDHMYAEMGHFMLGSTAPRRMNHWILAAPREFARPIPAAGAQGLWLPAPGLQDEIRRADDQAIQKL